MVSSCVKMTRTGSCSAGHLVFGLAVKVVVGEGQPGCRTNAVDCSRCLSGSGRVAVGGGIGGGGGGRSYSRGRSRCAGAREPGPWCSSLPGNQRMVPHAKPATADTSEESWARLGQTVSKEVTIGQRSILVGFGLACLQSTSYSNSADESFRSLCHSF